MFYTCYFLSFWMAERLALPLSLTSQPGWLFLSHDLLILSNLGFVKDSFLIRVSIFAYFLASLRIQHNWVFETWAEEFCRAYYLTLDSSYLLDSVIFSCMRRKHKIG